MYKCSFPDCTKEYLTPKGVVIKLGRKKSSPLVVLNNPEEYVKLFLIDRKQAAEHAKNNSVPLVEVFK